ncbi:LamG-like jellyroll fold domain-containing protein [Flavobacterium sp. DSR3-2]|uniref:LamG-like jellyroll fold domain-containing protein n=1 Tax=Flavobacterium sp. DSR3-2 TaxID=2804634 RepID=UPI003CE7DA44
MNRTILFSKKTFLTLVFLFINFLGFLKAKKTKSISFFSSVKEKECKTPYIYWMLPLIILFVFLSGPNINAQTVLISPTGDGGFETGATFASNGWTVVNGGNNKWYNGTAVKTNGIYGAYIDRNVNGGSTNEYNATVIQINYIYKDLTIPPGATNINLNFKWRCVGENGTGADEFDFIRVFLVSNSTPIVAGTLLTAGRIGLVKYNASDPTSFAASAPITIANSVAGTTQRLVFCWNNNNATGSNPAGAIDEVSLTYTPAPVTPPPTITSLSATNGCPNTSITINGTNLTGATAANVKIGGTAVSSITSNSGTQIVAVIGTGKTGTVSITTSGGTAISAATFTVNSGPTADAGTALADICKGSTTVALGGSYGGSATAGVWSSGTAAGTFTNNTGATPNTTTWTPEAVYSGTATLTLTTSGGACGTTTATKIQIVNTPIISGGSALSAICQGATTAALGGSFGGSATAAIWTDGGVGGTFTNNSGTTPTTTKWSPPPAYTGTVTLTLTTSGGACGTVVASKTQVVNAGVTASVGSLQNIYTSFLSTSLGGNSPGAGTGSWTKVSGPGTVTFSATTSGASTATVSSYGIYVFRWSITNSCGNSSADIGVTYSVLKKQDYTLFYEDFDSSDGGWTNTTSTNGSWLRTSSYPNTFTSTGAGDAEMGENSFWRINSFANYANNAVLEIESPAYNFTGYQNLLFNIDIRYDTELNNDGMRILYSINGATYQPLGTMGGTNSVNWYNTTTVSSLGSNGWSNNNIDTTKPLTFQPANRFIRATTPLDDTTFKNKLNVKFKIQFKSNASTTDNGVAFDNLSIEGDASAALTVSPIAPAKINQNLSLWFKTNAGITVSDGAALTAWDDQAYDTTRADLINKESAKALTTDAPTYRDNAARNINFNPVVDFDLNTMEYMKGKGGLYSQDYFVVIYSDDVVGASTGINTREIPLGGKGTDEGFHEDPTGLGLGSTTSRYTNEVIAHNIGSYNPNDTAPTPGVDSYGRAFVSSTTTYNEPLIINVKTNATGTATEIYKNGIKLDNTTGRTGSIGDKTLLNFYEYKNLPFYIGTGRSGISGRTNSNLNGRLSEIVSYSVPNSELNQQKIQSYLGLKYGVTMHTTESTDPTALNDVNYIDAGGNIIWNTTTNVGYNYDVAGIGRDDNSQLNQKQSKSVNSPDDITIGLTNLYTTNNLNINTFDTDKKFLVWGNNHGTLSAQPAVIVNISSGITTPSTLNSDVSFISVGRTWKVVGTGGNVGTAKVSIPATMLTATITPPGDYLMFVSSTTSFDPTAEYRIMSANGLELETTYDFIGVKYITFGYAPEKTLTRCIKFDGTNDFLDAGKVLNLNTSFTVSAWINKNTDNFNKTILSKRNSSFSEGYDLSINSTGRAEMSWYVGTTKKTITSNAIIPRGKWHHVGVTFNGTTAKIYIDGVNKVSTTLAGAPTATTQSFLLAAADGVAPTALFDGSIDEVRVWDIALTDAQFRYVINQEISQDISKTKGTIIPTGISQNDIGIIAWTSLKAYYPMSTYTYTNAKDMSNSNYTAALRNLTTVDRQTAPLPYESEAITGNWETVGTWINSTVQDLPYSISIEDPAVPALPALPVTIDWNIVKVKNPNTKVTSVGNKKVLGLFVDANANLIATTNGGLQTEGTKIEVSHYLKLDGKIDLAGRSQLVQTEGSDLDPTSMGSLERDQQGQANTFNYNYWGSPVGTKNNTLNNNIFTVAGVLRDGTDPSVPKAINWIPGYNGSPGPPINLAGYWIYKFDSNLNAVDYANWTQIGENGMIQTGKGFTLKGSGTTGTQNLTFEGKPNNGTIANTVSANQLLLVGNPYPSALDATAFIADNSGSIDTTTPTATDGALYFWEHYPGNNTHNLGGYQGGYGVRNAATGVAPSSVGVDFINPSGVSTRPSPNQYIPVGQGFFVIGNATGGTVTFKNSQRAFITENSTESQIMYKIPTKPKGLDHWTDNSNDPVAKDTYKRVRLGFNNYNEIFHRQVVVAFMNEKANGEINEGYDAENIDDVANDMYLVNSEKELIIEGEGYFDETSSYPIGVRSDSIGKISFVLDGLENFDENQKVFIYDKSDETYHNIKDTLYEVELPKGTFNDRFYLRFTDKTLGTDSFNLSKSDGVIVVVNQNVTVQSSNQLIKNIVVYDLLGRKIDGYKKVNAKKYTLSHLNKTTAGLIVKITLDNDTVVSKKIIY